VNAEVVLTNKQALIDALEGWTDNPGAGAARRRGASSGSEPVLQPSVCSDAVLWLSAARPGYYRLQQLANDADE